MPSWWHIFTWHVTTFVKIPLPTISNLSLLTGHWNCHRAGCKPTQNTSNLLQNNKKFIRRRDAFIYHASGAPTSHKSAQTFSHAQQSFFLVALSKLQSCKMWEMILAHNLMQHCSSRFSVSGFIILQPKDLNCVKGIFSVKSHIDLIIQIFCKKLVSSLFSRLGLLFRSKSAL